MGRELVKDHEADPESFRQWQNEPFYHFREKTPTTPKTMTLTCRRAIDSIRECGRLNLIQALAATLAGRPRMAAYHRKVAQECRDDAHALQITAMP